MLRPARLTDVEPIRKFCLSQEERIVPIIDKLFAGMKKRIPILRNLWINVEGNSITGLVHSGGIGLFLPYFTTKTRAKEASIELFKPFMDLFAVVGLDQSALPFIETFGQPTTHWRYTQLVLPTQSPSSEKPCASFKYFTQAKIDNIVYRRATHHDVEALMALEEAYQIEEVLTPSMRFVPESGRATLVNLINSNSLLLAQCHDLIVAKGCINARSFNYAQIGGIYTRPEWRSRGIATNLMNLIREAMLSQGFGMTLFVRTENHSALRVYARTGFSSDMPFSIAYYQE